MQRTGSFFLSMIIILVLASSCQAPGMSADLLSKSPVINSPVILPAQLKSFPVIAVRNPDVPEDYKPVADNGTLRLYIRKASSAVIIEDLRSGKLWRSSPEGLADNKGTTTAWRRQIEFPVQVAFVDAERSQPKNAKVEREVKLSTRPVKDGVQVTYNIENLKLALDVVYALQDDCLYATIPETTVVEGGKNGFVSVDLLAYFGATQDGEDGYVVYPDGSGAIMRFDSPHPAEVQKINSVVYGTDASGGIFLGSGNFHENVTMPVYGVVRGTDDDASGFAGMITNGDFDASIGVARSGKGINYNHVWTTFIYRRQGRFSMTGGQPAWLYQPDRITGDRSIRYCFLNGKGTSYVKIGERYRDFLLEERGAKRIDQVSREGEDSGGKTAAPAMHLGFFMGTERSTWFLSDMIGMSTFSDVQNILAELDDAGVSNVDISLWNWNHGGISGKYPQRFPVDKRIGGEEELRSLSEDIHQRGQRLFLNDEYIGVAPGAPGITPFIDASRGVDGLPVGDAERGYLINPQVALRNFAVRDIPQMKPLGADGLELSGLASLAIPDKNQRYPLSRESFAATYMQIGGISRQLFGAVAMEGGNVYAVPYTDRLDYVSIDSTHYDLFEETIPLYQIVVHGLAQYTNAPYNLVSDGKRIFLRQIEYGAMPYFLLTSNNSAELMRTNANGIYSSEFRYWRDEVVKQYQAVEKLQPLASQFIIDHGKIAEEVYQTVYEDGSRVIVNYNAQPFTAGAIQVPAQDFIVVRGE